MNDINSNKSTLRKTMILDFVFAGVCLFVAFFFLNPDMLTDLTMTADGQNISQRTDLYIHVMARPFMVVYGIHRLYSGFKNLILVKE